MWGDCLPRGSHWGIAKCQEVNHLDVNHHFCLTHPFSPLSHLPELIQQELVGGIYCLGKTSAWTTSVWKGCQLMTACKPRGDVLRFPSRRSGRPSFHPHAGFVLFSSRVGRHSQLFFLHAWLCSFDRFGLCVTPFMIEVVFFPLCKLRGRGCLLHVFGFVVSCC